MVIKYDDVQPHLNEIEVIDKRGSSGSDKKESDAQNDNVSNSSDTINNSQEIPDTPNNAISEREKIYQRGPEGLKEIKKERLENWLANSKGAGAQTEQRIIMVFERNQSVHRNPNVLYNLLDDELNASASYLNTMVQDIFMPEEEHADLLTSQGYTPWYSRNQPSTAHQGNIGQGGPMNATGSSGFNPNTGMGNQQAQRYSQPSSTQRPQPNQQNNPRQHQTSNQSEQSSKPESQKSTDGESDDDGISRQEAEMMMQQAMTQAEQQNQKNALLSGLSDATDEAVREMATNVGGLAGTMQKVIDEALVSYARDNPEWVIENMDILQKVIGATDGVDKDGAQSKQQSKEDQKVDDTLSNIQNQSRGQQNPSMNSRDASINNNTRHASETNAQPQNHRAHIDKTQQDVNSEELQQYDESNTSSQQDKSISEDTNELNPDLDDSMMGDSEFDPEYDTSNFKREEVVDDDESVSGLDTSDSSENIDKSDSDSSPDGSEEGFDDIFGDITEG